MDVEGVPRAAALDSCIFEELVCPSAKRQLIKPRRRVPICSFWTSLILYGAISSQPRTSADGQRPAEGGGRQGGR